MNSHHELAEQKGIRGERRLRLSVEKVHQSTSKHTSVRAAWHSVCKASCFLCRHCRYVSWKIVIEHNYVVLWVKFNISCWFYSNRRTEDISLQTFLFSLQFVSPPALCCWWHLPHLTTCHIWKHKTHLAKPIFLWWNGRKSDSAASLSCSPQGTWCSYLSEVAFYLFKVPLTEM